MDSKSRNAPGFTFMPSILPNPNVKLEAQKTAAAEAVSNENGCDVFLYSGSIYAKSAFKFTRLVRGHKSRDNVLLYLTTGGGDADAAFRMARCLQFAYPTGRIAVFVNFFCKSAGTLVTIGANEVVMSSESEIGPLDVQIAKADTLGERTSGLTPMQSVETLRNMAFGCFEQCFLSIYQKSGGQITTRTAARIAVQLATGLFRPIFGQVDPMKLGEFQRSLMVAEQYGNRLNVYGNMKGDALQRLIAGYPSHSFVIDMVESLDIFKNIRAPTEKEIILARLVENEVLNSAASTDPRAEAHVKCLSHSPQTGPPQAVPQPSPLHDQQTIPGDSEVSAPAGAGGGAPNPAVHAAVPPRRPRRRTRADSSRPNPAEQDGMRGVG
jgi:Serine dehydrogenase proteinase